MRVQRPAVSAVLDGVPTVPEAAIVSVDESWTRYVVAELTVPLAPEVLDLDLSTSPRGRVLAQTWHTTGMSMADVTGAAGGDVSDWTAWLDGVSLTALTLACTTPLTDHLVSVAAVTAILGTRLAAWSTWMADRPLAVVTAGLYDHDVVDLSSAVRSLDLVIHDRQARWSTRQAIVRLCTDEELLERYALIDTVPRTPAVMTVSAAVRLALSAIGAVLTPGWADGPIDDVDAATWRPGVSGWEYVAPLVESAGLRLWCDGRRDWHLAREATVLPVLPLGGALVELETPAPHWCDAAVLTYRWSDAAGVHREAYDTYAAVPVPQSVYTATIERPRPAPGAARAIVERSTRRRSAATLRAMTDLTATPWRQITWTRPDGALQAGVIQRVDFDLATDEMTITTRDPIGA